MDYFFTPNGLKIRLSENICSLVKYRTGVSHHSVMLATEQFVCHKEWFVFLLAMVMFIFHASMKEIFTFTFLISLLGSLSYSIGALFHVYSILGITQPRVFQLISSWHIDKAVLFGVGLFFVGWKGVLVYFAGFYAASILGLVLSASLFTKMHFKQYGLILTETERVFIRISAWNSKEELTYHEWIVAYSETLANLRKTE